jgi:hypothetical protein
MATNKHAQAAAELSSLQDTSSALRAKARDYAMLAQKYNDELQACRTVGVILTPLSVLILFHSALEMPMSPPQFPLPLSYW